MRAKLLLWLLLLYSGSTWAQNLSIQESFEASNQDYGYTSNTFNTSLTQYFYRAQNPVPGFGNPAGSANMLNANGNSFWACEGVRGTGNTTPVAGSVPGIVTLNAINNTQNYTNLKVIVAAGDPRSGTNIARTTDHLRVQYAYGDPNGTYTTLFEFTGTANGGSSSWTRVAVQGTNVTGTAAVLSSTFSDHESSIPGGVGALYIRVEADYQGSNKEVAFDNIRVTGTRATSAAPQLANIESTSVNYAEGGGPVQITNTLTVADADNTTLTGGTVRIAANLDATEDQLLYTNGSGITGSYSTSTGVLTLSGTATLAAYQAALRSVQYQNTNATNASPLARTIAFGVTDPSGVTSNVATRTITVTTALNAASALPYTENFDSDGEGTRYGSNTKVSNSQGFVRLTNASGGSATPGSGFVNGTTTTFTNVQGPGYWYTNGTQGGIVSGSVGQLTLAPVNSTGFVNLHFKVRVGAASSGGGFTSNEFLRFSYSTDGGTSWTTFANYTGASGQLYLNGNTANPVLDTSLDNADFALTGIAAGATISFRAETNSGGSEQIVFDDIQITGQQQTTVNSLVRASTNPTNAATVNYTVSFGTPVTGLTAANFTLTTTGTVSGVSVGTPVSTGTGNTWTVPVNMGTGSGTLRLNLANDANLSADITTTLPFAGETYTVDKTAPVVSSVLVPANGTYRAAQTLSFVVNFTEAVTVTGTPQVALIIGSTTRQATYTSGNGSIALTFNYPIVNDESDLDGITVGALALNGGTIRDAVGNTATLTLNNVPSTAGILVDAVAPTVSSSTRQNPTGTSTSGTSVTFRVTFSEAVTGVTADSFVLVTTTGSTNSSGKTVAAVSGSNGTQDDVTVNGLSGNGRVRLDVPNSSSGITDLAGNALGLGISTGQTYDIAQAAVVTAVTGLTPTPAATSTVSYQVSFSGAVLGLTPSNFNLTTSSGFTTAPSISSVSGSGTTYTVVVNTGAGDGTLSLNVNTDAGVTPRITNLPYTSGTQYTITKSFAAGPTLRIQAAGSASNNGDVTAFVDVVQVLQSGTSTVVANGLQNGSFESNNVTPGSFKKTADGVVATSWNFTGLAGVARTGSAFNAPTPPNGDAVALVQSAGDNNASLSQNLTVPTGSYQVNFQTAQRNYTARDQRLNVFVNDVFVGNIQPLVYTSYEPFTSATFSVTAPDLTVVVSTTSTSPTSTAPIPFAVSFSQSVGTTFTAADVMIAGGVLTSGSFSGSGAGPYTFTVTPSGAGTVSVGVAAGVANDANNSSNKASNLVSVQFQIPAITVSPATSTLPGGTVGTPYSQVFSASGGSGTYTYALIGTPPPGLTLTGRSLSGTPTASGTFTFTVTATDNSAAPGPFSGARSYSLTIGYPDLIISTSGQTVPAGTYNSITVQRGGVGTLAGNVIVNGDVTVQSGGVLNDGCALISGAGSFTLAAGGTLSICSAQGISSSGATGTVQVTGTRSFSSDALYTYAGTVAQSTGTGLPTTVRVLTLTNPAGLSLTNALTTTTAATFTSGVLTTGANTLTLGSGATLGEDADGYVIGTVQATRNLATTGSPEAFGGLGLMLTPSGNTLPGSTVVRRTTGMALRGAGTSTSIKRYFDIQPTVNTGLNVALVLIARDDERNGIAPNNLRLFKSENNGNSWQLQVATYGTSTANGLTTYSASLSGISDFSLWTLGDANAPLPVTLVSFQALLQDENRAVLRWATSSELHSAYFAVERSLDGRAFVEVGRVAAAGTSLLAHTYELRDPLPLTGQTYYRLRQVDDDKSVTYSPVVILSPRMQPVAAVSVYPNPRIGTASTNVSVQGLANQRLTVQVTDMLGRTVSTQQVTPTTFQAAVLLQLPADLAAGIYGVSVNSGKQTWTTRLIVVP